MAYRKTLNINVFSPSSIAKAISILEDEKVMLEIRQEEFLKRLGKKMEDFLKPLYGGSFTVSSDSDKNMVMVMAEGEGLLFVEFGAGTPADTSEGQRFGYGAGTWSSWHANTYERWLKYGEFAKADGSYRYNSLPKDAFMQLETHLPDMINETAREVFKK